MRRALWDGGHGPIFPVEVEVETGADGRPVLRGPLAGRLCAAVAEEEGIAAAVVAAGTAGVAIERVGAREEEARALAAGARGRDGRRGRGSGGDAARRRLHHRLDVHVMDSERNPRKVLEVVAALVHEVIGDDGGLGPPIAMETSFNADLELESIEFVALAEKLTERYGQAVDFAGWLAGMELEAILALQVGDLVRFIVGRLGG